MSKKGKQSTEKTFLYRFALLDRLPVNAITASGLSVAELTSHLMDTRAPEEPSSAT